MKQSIDLTHENVTLLLIKPYNPIVFFKNFNNIVIFSTIAIFL